VSEPGDQPAEAQGHPPIRRLDIPVDDPPSRVSLRLGQAGLFEIRGKAVSQEIGKEISYDRPASLGKQMLIAALIFLVAYIGMSALLSGGLTVGAVVVGLVLATGILIPIALMKRQRRRSR
jgi:Flp pilus assembly protein TadB